MKSARLLATPVIFASLLLGCGDNDSSTPQTATATPPAAAATPTDTRTPIATRTQVDTATATPPHTATATAVNTPSATPTPTANDCLEAVSLNPSGTALEGIDRIEVTAVTPEGCGPLDGPLAAFNWFSFADRERYLRYGAGIAQILAERGTRLLTLGEHLETLEAPPGTPAGGGAYVHDELAIPLYPSAAGFLDMVASDAFQAIIADQQAGARQEDYVFGFQECLVGCDRTTPAAASDDAPLLLHIFRYEGNDIRSAIRDLSQEAGSPEMVYGGRLVGVLRVLIGETNLNTQNQPWGDGVVVFRFSSRDEARNWVESETHRSFRESTAEDVLVLLGSSPVTVQACDAEPVLMTTSNGTEFVRTPDACFASLPEWPYAPQYVEIDGLRQAYVDDGPEDGPVVLLLHGQPSWSYLYRKMIPGLADAGYRVIAMDHLGMGRSDKPIDIQSYSYLGHYDRLVRFIEALGLRDINLFAQDWGSLIGLRAVGLNPDWFATVTIGDGDLPVIPEGFQPFPVVESPDEVLDIPSPFEALPAQQVPFYDGCEPLIPTAGDFGQWMIYSMKAASFRPSEVLEAITWFDLPEDEEAAYDAPFPSRIYMAGPRVFPSLVNELAGVNDEAWEGLTSFERPFLALWASNDPGNLGRCETQQKLIDSIPGAAGQPHDRLAEASHFLQDDQGEEIARRMVEFIAATPTTPRVVAHEIFEPSDMGLIGWGTLELTTEEYDALELPEGWRRNEPREVGRPSGGPTGGRFLRSPGREADGEFTFREMFGVTWLYQVTIVDVIGPVDDQNLLFAAIVEKHHEVSWAAGSSMTVLTSPEGERYVLITRDARRMSDTPTIPTAWTLETFVVDEDVTFVLPVRTTNIRADNQDSFQGPVPTDIEL